MKKKWCKSCGGEHATGYDYCAQCGEELSPATRRALTRLRSSLREELIQLRAQLRPSFFDEI